MLSHNSIETERVSKEVIEMEYTLRNAYTHTRIRKTKQTKKSRDLIPETKATAAIATAAAK